jgi:hypothetical protein
MGLTKEQMEAVQAQVPAIGLVMAYYGRFGEDAFQVAKEYFAQMGKMMGENIKRNLNISGSDATAVAAVVNAFILQAAGVPDMSKIEGNQVILVNEGFCPVMEAVKMLNAPWDKIDICYAWPMFEAMALAVNPNAKLEILEARHRGDRSCKHVFTVP